MDCKGPSRATTFWDGPEAGCGLLGFGETGRVVRRRMSFLAPLFLVGAAAVALPILFHLIRRTSKEKVVFSSLMFLTASPPRLTRRSRIEHWLLLLMRAAVLALIAAAFARPFLRSIVPNAPVAGETSRLVVLVDSSGSMRRAGLWEEARERASGLVRSAAVGQQVAVLVFDSGVRPLISFAETAAISPSERGTLAETRLGGLQPSYFSTHLDNALIEAAELISDAGNTNAAKADARGEIVVVSDLGAGSKLEGLQGYEWPKSVTVRLERVKSDQVSNASLQVVGEGAGRQLLSTNAARVRVQNNEGAKGEQFELAWTRGNQLLSPKAQIYVPPGQGRVVAAPMPAAASGATELTLFGDGEVFDNTIFHVASERSSATVLYFGPEPENDPQGGLYYLKRALEDGSGGVVKVVRGSQPTSGPASMVVISGPMQPGDFAKVEEALALGKTVLVTAGKAGAAEAIERLVKVPIRVSEGSVQNYVLFSKIDFRHPLFAPFADAKFSDFTKLNFWKYRKIDLSAATNAVLAARFDNGDPGLIEFGAGAGRIYLLASTWAPADSQFALSTKFVPLLFTMLEQGGQLLQSTPSYVAGQPVNVATAGELSGPELAPRRVEAGNFTPERPGVYSLDGKPAFAVNMDPAESRITPLATEVLQALSVPIRAPQSAAREVAEKQKQQQQLLDAEMENRQKLWRAALVAALVLLLLETVLAKRASAALVPA